MGRVMAERMAAEGCCRSTGWSSDRGFDGAGLAALRLVDATPTTTGVLIATYRPAAAAGGAG